MHRLNPIVLSLIQLQTFSFLALPLFQPLWKKSPYPSPGLLESLFGVTARTVQQAIFKEPLRVEWFKCRSQCASTLLRTLCRFPIFLSIGLLHSVKSPPALDLLLCSLFVRLYLPRFYPFALRSSHTFSPRGLCLGFFHWSPVRSVSLILSSCLISSYLHIDAFSGIQLQTQTFTILFFALPFSP